MAHAQKPDLVFRQNGWVHLNRQGCQFSRLLAAEVCASAVVMLNTPCSEVAWEYWLPTPFATFPFTSPPVRHRVPSGFNWTLPWSFEMSGAICPAAQHHVPEDLNPQQRCCETSILTCHALPTAVYVPKHLCWWIHIPSLVTVRNRKSSPSFTVISDLCSRVFGLPLHTILQCAESQVLQCPAIKLHI